MQFLVLMSLSLSWCPGWWWSSDGRGALVAGGFGLLVC
jgi:hypothetical protein